MTVVTISKYSKQNTIILKKKKYTFSPYEKKVVKRRKKKESPVKTDPDEMYDLFCSGEGRGERE